jgi:hypothetical protein
MNILAQKFLIGVAVVFLPISAYAEDTVTIRYLGGYPPPGTSSEWINLRVSRTNPPETGAPKQDVDLVFERVSAALTENGVGKDWQLAIPDAPAIEITVDINGRKVTLVSCHVSLERNGKYLVTERGGYAVPDEERDALLAKQSKAFRLHRIAFETILRLTLERARAQLSPHGPIGDGPK